jgi:hypothetical protein
MSIWKLTKPITKAKKLKMVDAPKTMIGYTEEVNTKQIKTDGSLTAIHSVNYC